MNEQNIPQSNEPVQDSKHIWIIIIAIIATALIVGGGVYAWQRSSVKKTEQNLQQQIVSLQEQISQLQQNNALTLTPTKSDTSSDKSSDGIEEPKEVVAAANCDAFPDKLSSCTKYKCQFVHPFTGETMQKEITGIVGGKCNYVEQMPNNGKLECNYTTSQRTAAAQYYKDVAAAESTGTSMNLNLGSGEQKTTYTIDGKEVENPLQTFTTDGTCVISGY